MAHTKLISSTLVRWLAAAAFVFAASPAFAGTMFFGEVLTATQLGDERFTLDSSSDIDLLDIMMDGNSQSGAGFGDGQLDGRGDSLTATLTFAPSMAWESITKATVYVGVAGIYDRVAVKLDGDRVARGSIWGFRIFDGDATAYFVSNGNEIDVAVVSRRGEPFVGFIGSVIEYETAEGPEAGQGGGGTDPSPVPEPTALALFATGLFVVRQGTRRAS